MSPRGISKTIVVIGIIVIIAIAAVIAMTMMRPPTPTIKYIRIATLGVGSSPHVSGALIVEVLARHLPKEYSFSIYPYRTTIDSVAAGLRGDVEFAYGSASYFYAAYHGKSPFTPSPEFKRKLYPVLFYATYVAFPIVPAERANEFKSWADFSGKPAFYTPAGYTGWAFFKRFFEIAGYEFNHVEMDVSAVADALKAGTIVGTVVGIVGSALPPWMKDIEIRMDIKVVNPSPEEIKKLKEAGFVVMEVDPKGIFTRDVGVDKIIGIAEVFGWDAPYPEVSEDLVYMMLKAIYNESKILSNNLPYLSAYKDFVEMEVLWVEVHEGIPVHPGLAKFLKEQGVWREEWSVAS